jgi:hypothetical protein
MADRESQTLPLNWKRKRDSPPKWGGGVLGQTRLEIQGERWVFDLQMMVFDPLNSLGIMTCDFYMVSRS